ncbi:uncharacterized protein LOC122723507 [Manihot esculenta]|uniref:Uncharacterized protein n=1 Tax=Manihot esculenta TaxID=3983 RepID=A0A2C9W1G7_MANES|nr:uncharacterized protein LOC122723507 [Manihot esculenta]
MELFPSKSTPQHHRRHQTLPPKRGQIKAKIFKDLIKSASSTFASLGKSFSESSSSSSSLLLLQFLVGITQMILEPCSLCCSS